MSNCRESCEGHQHLTVSEWLLTNHHFEGFQEASLFHVEVRFQLVCVLM